MKHETRPVPRAPGVVWAAGAVLLLVYLAAIDDVGGLWGDDALYIVLAKALAGGAGYVDLSSPTPALVAPPPGFPALLSLVFHVSADFPGNLPLLKLVPIVSAAAFWTLSGLLLWRRQGGREWAVAAILVAAGLHPFIVAMLGSTVMADFPYAAAAAAALLLAERYIGRDDVRLVSWPLALTATAIAAAGYVRVVGVVLPVAVLGYALARRRSPDIGKALVLLAVSVVLLLPTAASYRNYGRIMATMPPTSGPPAPASAADDSLPAQLTSRARDLFGTALPAALFWPAYAETPAVQRQYAAWPGLRVARDVAAALAAVAIAIGFLAAARRQPRVMDAYVVGYLAMLVAVPLPGGYVRYLFPILPFLLFYLVVGLQRSVRSFGVGALTATAAVALVLATSGATHAALSARRLYDLRVRPQPRSELYAAWRARMETYGWLAAFDGRDGRWAVVNPQQFYLYVDRPAIGTPHSLADARKAGIRYLHVPCEGGGRSEPAPWWKNGSLQRLFVSRDGRECVYVVASG